MFLDSPSGAAVVLVDMTAKGLVTVLLPLVWGLRRISICLPADTETWENRDRRMVLVHELAHVHRGDHLWQLLAVAVTTLHWFNPLAWWAAYRLRVEAEIACDDAVINAGFKPSDYAACLYRIVRTARSASLLFHPPLAMAGRSGLTRRFAMILNEKTTRKQLPFRSLVLPLFASAFLGSVLGAAQLGPAQESETPRTPAEAKGEGASDICQINATPLDEAGAYHITPVFEKIVRVMAIPRAGSGSQEDARVLDDWHYDRKTGLLTVTAVVDDTRERILVFGERTVPWRWQMGQALTDVKVIIGNELAVRGEDYVVDEVAGTVLFLKREHWRRDVHYNISYRYRDRASGGGSIGNHPDRVLVRQLLGISSFPESSLHEGFVGTAALRTDDPKVWNVVLPLHSDTIHVGLSRLGDARIDWLESGTDFAYDESQATIRILREIPLDEDLWLNVRGVPIRRWHFHFHSPLNKGTVVVRCSRSTGHPGTPRSLSPGAGAGREGRTPAPDGRGGIATVPPPPPAPPGCGGGANPHRYGRHARESVAGDG